jgi:hypothetical protein
MRLAGICVALAAALAGCVAMGSRLQTSSADLDRHSQRFYEEIRDNGADRESVRDAQDLADAADELHRAVEHGTPRENLDDEFDRVARYYHDLRERYDHNGTREERERFEDVTTAYLEVEGALKYR